MEAPKTPQRPRHDATLSRGGVPVHGAQGAVSGQFWLDKSRTQEWEFTMATGTLSNQSKQVFVERFCSAARAVRPGKSRGSGYWKE